MASARAALIHFYRGKWFFHKTRLCAFNDIQRLGLQPSNPGKTAPDIVRKRLGCRGSLILCLRPDRSPRIVFNDPRIILGVAAADLPFQLGLDWSHDTWRIAGIRKANNPSWDDAKVFVSAVASTGSVASYDAVPASQLRACPKSAPSSPPETWPLLSKTKRDDLAVV